MTLNKDQEETLHRLLSEIQRRLLEAKTEDDRAGVFAWAMEQGATIAQIRDVFDAWENSPERSKQADAKKCDGGGSDRPTGTPALGREILSGAGKPGESQAGQVDQRAASTGNSQDPLEEPRPAGSM